MRAAVINKHGVPPVFGEFREPEAQDGEVLIEVDTAGLGGWDVLGEYRLAVEYPCVIRGEGVGRTREGKRVYFGERARAPFGAWAERVVVPEPEVWDVPDDIDDKTAITMAIAGTGSYIPLQDAKIKPGDSVLVLGATGVLGQLGLQLARIMGAGRVVGAARNQPALDRLMARGIADAVVRLGSEDDVAALKAEAGEGFDVVLDLVCGAPLMAALKATRWGARIVTVGAGAGLQVSFNIADLLFRTMTLIGTGQRPPADRRRIWEELLRLSQEHDITVDYTDYELEQISEAWQAQKTGAYAKITSRIKK
ncbi:MAG: quinone oxidoreductase family protein [Janthinobacterium lividum]